MLSQQLVEKTMKQQLPSPAKEKPSEEHSQLRKELQELRELNSQLTTELAELRASSSSDGGDAAERVRAAESALLQKVAHALASDSELEEFALQFASLREVLGECVALPLQRPAEQVP